MPLIDPKNTQVILIGTSEIEDENFSPIPNVIGNLGELQGLLFTVVGIDKSHIHPFFDKDNDSEITRKVIEIVPKATNTVIVYYAGHCVRHKQELYLTTTGTQSREPKTTGAIFAGDLLQTVIDKSKPNTNIIFILDCCLSGLASKYIDDKERKVFLITATSSNETAKDESPKDKNLTAFTEALLSIFKEGIDFAGKNLTIQDIFTGLKQKLVSQNLPQPKMVPYGSPDELEICENRAFKNSSRTANNKSVKVYDMVQKPFLLAAFVTLVCVIAIYTLMNALWQDTTDSSPPQITENGNEGEKTLSTKSEKLEKESGSHIEIPSLDLSRNNSL